MTSVRPFGTQFELDGKLLKKTEVNGYIPHVPGGLRNAKKMPVAPPQLVKRSNSVISEVPAVSFV